MDWYFDGLHATYRATFMFLWIAVWTSTLVTLGYPLCLYIYRKVHALGFANLSTLTDM